MKQKTDYRFFAECDGVVMNTTSQLEGPAIEAWKSWFKERPVISAGPTDFEIVDGVQEKSADTLEVTKFLDSMLEKYGSNSVVFVRFSFRACGHGIQTFCRYLSAQFGGPRNRRKCGRL